MILNCRQITGKRGRWQALISRFAPNMATNFTISAPSDVVKHFPGLC